MSRSMSKKSIADAKRLDNINKTYVCDDGIITKRKHKLKKAPEIVHKDGEESKPPKPPKVPTAWALHLKAFYAKAKAKDPKYTYKQSMKDASATYIKPVKPVKVPKAKGKAKGKMHEESKVEHEYKDEERPISSSSSSKPTYVVMPSTAKPIATTTRKATIEELSARIKDKERLNAIEDARNMKRIPFATKAIINDLVRRTGKPKSDFKKYTHKTLEKIWLKHMRFNYDEPPEEKHESPKPPSNDKDIIDDLMTMTNGSLKFFTSMSKSDLQNLWKSELKNLRINPLKPRTIIERSPEPEPKPVKKLLTKKDADEYIAKLHRRARERSFPCDVGNEDGYPRTIDGLRVSLCDDHYEEYKNSTAEEIIDASEYYMSNERENLMFKMPSKRKHLIADLVHYSGEPIGYWENDETADLEEAWLKYRLPDVQELELPKKHKMSFKKAFPEKAEIIRKMMEKYEKEKKEEREEAVKVKPIVKPESKPESKPIVKPVSNTALKIITEMNADKRPISEHKHEHMPISEPDKEDSEYIAKLQSLELPSAECYAGDEIGFPHTIKGLNVYLCDRHYEYYKNKPLQKIINVSENWMEYKKIDAMYNVPDNKKLLIKDLVAISEKPKTYWKNRTIEDLQDEWLKNKIPAIPRLELPKKGVDNPENKSKPVTKPIIKIINDKESKHGKLNLLTIMPTKSKKLISDLMKHSGKSKEHYKKYTKAQLQKRWLKIYGTSDKPPEDTKTLIYGLMDLMDKDEKYFKKMTREQLEKLWYNEIKKPM